MTHEEFILQIKEIIEKSEKNEQDRENLMKDVALGKDALNPKMLQLCNEGISIAFNCIHICKTYIENNT
jgi:hypothetical protein